MMDQYQEYIHRSRYARWVPELNRRETWKETTRRYATFWEDKGLVTKEEANVISSMIEGMYVMPSMRALATAGPALERDSMAGYNCAYLAIDDARAFDEIMYVLMNGTGMGFSVERQYVSKLPVVPEQVIHTQVTIVVEDSKEGWASAYRELISYLYAGYVNIKWDLSNLRPKGAPLRTFGGRSSGPDPLDDLFHYTLDTFCGAAGRKLTSLECHDLICKIGEIVVVGGVRRSALISLSNLSDDRMRAAKTGQWYIGYPHRALANNSAVYAERPDFEVFLREWLSLHESKAGERGVFSRAASQRQAGVSGRRDTNHEFGTNPCSEIILRSAQVCNLSEVIVRADDTLTHLKYKVRIATMFGTLQSTLTNFQYVRSIWRKNTEEERLLGVSLTGIMDHPVLSDPHNPHLALWLKDLREEAIQTNKEWAERLGIPQSTAITCVKPSGTVSQLVDSASGIHARFSPYYIRRVRGDKKDPITTLLIDQGVPNEEDVMNKENVVFSFPQKAPSTALCVDEVNAMYQLRMNEVYEQHWAEHKISQTVYYTDDEFLQVGQWMWDNIESSSGISFLPKSDHVYRQAPYEEITETDFYRLHQSMPSIDWSKLSEYESEDHTQAAQTLACSGDSCEIL